MEQTKNLAVLSDASESIRYADPSLPLYIVAADLNIFPDQRALCHWHEDVEILMPIWGHLNYRVNGQVVELCQGDAIFVNARQMHYGYSADGTNCDYLCFTFKPQLLCQNETLQRRLIEPIIGHSGLAYVRLLRGCPDHAPLLAALLAAAEAYREKTPGCELAAVGQLALFWQGLYRLVQPKLGRTFAADPDAAVQKRMLDYLHHHYRERITLAQIAQAGGVCRSKCCKIFKNYLGRSPNDYLNSYRLEKSRDLLAGGTATIAEIAYHCGFGSASYFSELFLREKGLAPSAYRKLAGRKSG